jgi:fatty-acyl-CoA synthase
MSGFDHPWAALEFAVAQWPDAEALVFPHQGQGLSFSQWRERAAEMAGRLAAAGIRGGQHVALLAENRIEWPIAQMACAALGAVFVPVNTHYRRDDLAYVLKQSNAAALICSRGFRGNPYLENVFALRGQLPDLAHVFCLDDDWLREAGSFDHVATKVAALLYTSGTTGFPKGALLSHRAMMLDALGAAERLGLAAGDRWTSIIPLFHCAGCIMNILGCLQRGATYVGVPSFDAETMFRIIQDERCTFLSGVPTSYLAMLDHPARKTYDLSSLKAGSCGGPMPIPKSCGVAQKNFRCGGWPRFTGRRRAPHFLHVRRLTIRCDLQLLARRCRAMNCGLSILTVSRPCRRVRLAKSRRGGPW